MTAVSLTEFQSFIPGVKIGTASLADGYTSRFGLSELKGLTIGFDGNESLILFYKASITDGEATMDVRTSTGGEVGTPTNVFYTAWGNV